MTRYAHQVLSHRWPAVVAACLLVGGFLGTTELVVAASQDDAQPEQIDRQPLELAVAAHHRPVVEDGRRMRQLNVVVHDGLDRLPVDGRLTVTSGDEQVTRDATVDDFVQGALVVAIAEPETATEATVEYATEEATLRTKVAVSPPTELAYRDYVRTCLDTLIEHGRDDYGEIQSPLFMAVLDADTRRSPRSPLSLDSLVRLEGRIHRRGERGSNLWYDQTLLRALKRTSQLTGDEKYQTAAEDYVRYFLSHCRKQVDGEQTYLNGMPAWGTHVYWDCFADRPGGDGDGNGPHEILVFVADWQAMHALAPEQVERIVEGIWIHHVVDKQSGLHNRHDDQRQGCDFAFSGSSFLHAFASLYRATGNPEYLQRARTVADWHWSHRNEQTGLTADCPGLTERYDGNHCFTTVAGPHALALLQAYRQTGDPYFRDAAVGYIKSYDAHAWDPEAGTYWAMLKLDGTPLPDRPKGAGYDAYAPYGHVNVWRTTMFSYEFTLAAAQAAVEAYALSVDEDAADTELLAIANRWAGVVEAALPLHTGRRWKTELEAAMPRAIETGGAYAEDYGRAISLFTNLHRLTGEAKHKKLAEQLADEAIDKLFHNGVFLGHPAKPYYETTNGVGLLLVALLELDSPEEDFGAAY